MTPNMRLTKALTVLLFASIVLVACGRSKQEQAKQGETLIVTAVVEDEPEITVTTSEAESKPETLEPKKEIPVTLNWNLVDEPTTIDPGLSTDTISIDLVNNLFVRLTQFNPDTGEIEPYLATSWRRDEDEGGYPVWTFTLREDIPWVHLDPSTGEASQVVDGEGQPRFVNAYDVEYAVKRAVDPTTASSSAGMLYIIKNAKPIIMGELGYEIDMLGVKALDETTLQYTLEFDAAYFPAIAGQWVAAPVPQWTIEEYGDKWTEAGLINTNGPYMLESWDHFVQLDMVKNPFWIQAEDVQIMRVESQIINEESVAFTMYESNLLDIVDAPIRELDRIRSDPVLGKEYAIVAQPCTYYLGFTNNKAPFDDMRVRRAFTQAIDRQNLIDYVLKGGEILATSFAPPGVFGAPPPGDVGLQYNPEAARASLQEYLDEMGMTIEDFNALNIYVMTAAFESNVPFVEALKYMWQEVLGVNINHQMQEVGIYLNTLGSRTPLEEMPHIWQLAWCSDYSDENNWVHDVFHAMEGGNSLRRNCLDPNCNDVFETEFDELTVAAAMEADPARRVEMYAEAERMLAEEEVAYAPLYHSTKLALTKPWVQRNYPLMGGFDIYNWKLDMEAKLAAQGK